MKKRSYGQVCGVAEALDLLGERWTLLLVRELLLGPKRFGALEDALGGIGPNMLSARLASLTGAGIVERVELPPPASVSAYALTERGEGLREPVEALALWGAELLDPERQVEAGERARGSWLAATLAARAARGGPPADPGAVLNADVDGERFTIRLGTDRPHVRHGRDDSPDAELACDMRTFWELSTGRRESEDPEVGRVLAALGA